MKKKIFKIILSLIVLSAMNIIGMATTNAADPLEDLLKGLDDLTPCVDETGADNGKIITIIEEPLSSGEETVGDTIFRPCFRNTLQYTDSEKKSHTLSLLGKECSPNGQSLAARADEDLEQYKPKFSCKEVQVLLSTGGTSLIYGYIGMIYRWGASIVGIIAVLVIVLSGIQLSAAGGEQEAVTKAKTRILQSIAGIVVLFLSGLILYTINPNFFVT